MWHKAKQSSQEQPEVIPNRHPSTHPSTHQHQPPGDFCLYKNPSSNGTFYPVEKWSLSRLASPSKHHCTSKHNGMPHQQWLQESPANLILIQPWPVQRVPHPRPPVSHWYVGFIVICYLLMALSHCNLLICLAVITAKQLHFC